MGRDDFRPRKGNYVFISVNHYQGKVQDTGKFPSPKGELCFYIARNAEYKFVVYSFRPRKGNYVFILTYKERHTIDRFSVSVPERGIMFLYELL